MAPWYPIFYRFGLGAGGASSVPRMTATKRLANSQSRLLEPPVARDWHHLETGRRWPADSEERTRAGLPASDRKKHPWETRRRPISRRSDALHQVLTEMTFHPFKLDDDVGRVDWTQPRHLPRNFPVPSKDGSVLVSILLQLSNSGRSPHHLQVLRVPATPLLRLRIAGSKALSSANCGLAFEHVWCMHYFQITLRAL